MAGSERVRRVGDRALLRTFDGPVREANRAALACARALAAVHHEHIEDVVPGARTVLVVLRPGADAPPAVAELLGGDAWTTDPPPGRTVELPVRYGGDDGPDLGDVAGERGLSVDDVVRLHASVEYVVGFIGFSPGFAYLLGLDDRLVTPRLGTPRPRVAPGSVGIGGAYTGVYPAATPGGWRLIGRTDVQLFDAARESPSLLAPGDRVRFVPR